MDRKYFVLFHVTYTATYATDTTRMKALKEQILEKRLQFLKLVGSWDYVKIARMNFNQRGTTRRLSTLVEET